MRHGMSIPQIAAELGASVEDIEIELHNAFVKIRRYLLDHPEFGKKYGENLDLLEPVPAPPQVPRKIMRMVDEYSALEQIGMMIDVEEEGEDLEPAVEDTFDPDEEFEL